MTEKMNNEKGIEKIREKLNKNSEGIHISRIPLKTKRAFIELANEEFSSDYGMTLTFLMKGVISQETQALLDKIDNLDERLSYLELGSQEEKKVIKTLSGKEINKK